MTKEQLHDAGHVTASWTRGGLRVRQHLLQCGEQGLVTPIMTNNNTAPGHQNYGGYLFEVTFIIVVILLLNLILLYRDNNGRRD